MVYHAIKYAEDNDTPHHRHGYPLKPSPSRLTTRNAAPDGTCAKNSNARDVGRPASPQTGGEPAHELRQRAGLDAVGRQTCEAGPRIVAQEPSLGARAARQILHLRRAQWQSRASDHVVLSGSYEPTHTDFEVTTLGDERVVKRSRLGDEMLMPVTERSLKQETRLSWLLLVCCGQCLLLFPADARFRPSQKNRSRSLLLQTRLPSNPADSA